MAPDELIAHADLIRRYAESVKAGKPITVQYEAADRKWYDYEIPDTPDFDTHYRWREKPSEPRRFYVLIATGGAMWITMDKHLWEQQCKCYGGEAVEVVEVKPGDRG